MVRERGGSGKAPIFGMEKDGMGKEWNGTKDRITGFTKKEAMGQDLVERFISEESKQSVKSVLGRALEGQETANYELLVETKNGDFRTLLVNATTLRDVDRKILGVLGVAQDVADAYRRKIDTESMSGELRPLVESAYAPIFGIDKYGIVNYWHATAAPITCFT